MKEKLSSILIILFLSFASLSSIAGTRENESRLIFWEQNALLHNIMKNYMKLGVKAGGNKEIRELDNDVAQFEENLNTLSDMAAGTDKENAMDVIWTHWYKFRMMAISVPTRFDAPVFMYRGQEIIKKLSSLILQKGGADISTKARYFSNLLELSNDVSMYYYAHKWGWGANKAAGKSEEKDNWIYQLYLEKKEELASSLKQGAWLSGQEDTKEIYANLLESYKLAKVGMDSEEDNKIVYALDTLEDKFSGVCRAAFFDFLKE